MSDPTQELFLQGSATIKSFRATISEPRLSKYLNSCNGKEVNAIILYHWNALLSQSLYLPLQTWEIALRNRLNDFLVNKYSPAWPHDERVIRTLTAHDAKRLSETIRRQESSRKLRNLSVGMVVADLSAGFWVSLLSKRYEIPFVWRNNLPIIFPNFPTMPRQQAWRICDNLLDLRNRVAHHEPIYHLALEQNRQELSLLLSAMCDGAQAYAERYCTFSAVWRDKP